jgi:hypothetical protein
VFLARVSRFKLLLIRDTQLFHLFLYPL